MRLLITVALTAFAFAAPASAMTTCTEAIARCKLSGAIKPNIDGMCEAAGAACMKDGNFIGPVTHTLWKNLQKK